MVSKPEVIPDADHEMIVKRVCGIDVAKASASVCLRVPPADGGTRRTSKVWEVAATLNAVVELSQELLTNGVEKVTLESTGDYWRIWFYLLEAAGLSVELVNARDVKNVPGRPKTDKLDSVWLAKLTERGMLRPSFVPPTPIRELRDYTRMRVDLVHDRTRYWQRLEKLLEDALIKVSSVASSLNTLSCRDMIEALISGERDPRVLAELARSTMRLTHDALVEALTGRFDDHHAELARMLLERIDTLGAQIDKITVRIVKLLDAIVVDVADDEDGDDSTGATKLVTGTTLVEHLDEITGIGPLTAQLVLAEIGVDMSVFPTADHVASWAKLSPRTIQSGAKSYGGGTGKGNPYLKGALGEAAAAAARTNTFLGEKYRRIVKRRGKGKALVAVARSILVIIWHLVNDPSLRYDDLGPDYHTARLNTGRKVRNLTSQLAALGFTVTLESTTAA
ncbi:MAG: IS110 family transposase [Pseudonocardiaceae bacterium]